MNSGSKVLVGALIAVNLLLVGLLLFRDNSVARVRADSQAQAATAAAVPAQVPARASAPAVVEREGGTAFGVEVQPNELPAASSIEPFETAAERGIAPEPEAPARDVEPIYREEPRRTVSRETTRRPRGEVTTTRPAPRAKPVEVATNRLPDYGDPGSRAPENDEVWEAGDAGRDTEPAQAAQREVPVERAVPVAPVTVTVPAGTRLGVRLDVALNSRQVRSGDMFEGSLSEDLSIGGRRVAAAGAPVTGRVLEVVEAGRVQGREQMKLTLGEVTLAGKTYRVDTSSATFTAADDHNKDAAIVGGSTVVGMIIGAIAKGGKGAATGAAAGAAAGGGVVLGTKGKPVVLSAGSQLDFTLEESIRVTLAPGHFERSPAVPEERERRESDDDGGVARR